MNLVPADPNLRRPAESWAGYRRRLRARRLSPAKRGALLAREHRLAFGGHGREPERPA